MDSRRVQRRRQITRTTTTTAAIAATTQPRIRGTSPVAARPRDIANRTSGASARTDATRFGLTREIRDQAFRGEPAFVIGTGGFSRLFEREKLFDALLPDLILVGLERALSLNQGASGPWRAPATEVAP